MERCPEHVIVQGKVERSMKREKMVERTRRCGGCGSLFKTLEMTDDYLAFKRGGHDEVVKCLKDEVNKLENMFESIRTIDEMIEQVRSEIRGGEFR